jgi:hypothetical protein
MHGVKMSNAPAFHLLFLFESPTSIIRPVRFRVALEDLTEPELLDTVGTMFAGALYISDRIEPDLSVVVRSILCHNMPLPLSDASRFLMIRPRSCVRMV